MKLICLFGVVMVQSETWSDVKDDISIVVGELTNTETVRPVADLSNTLTVNIDMNIASLNNFDDTNGFMDISGYLHLTWTADAYTFGTRAVELLKHTSIWKPPILFVNALKNSEEVGSGGNSKIRYNFSSDECVWQPWFILRGACSPDVKYYPYDQQECSFQFAAWGYKSSEMIFQTQSSQINFNFFEENGAWAVDSTEASTSVVNDVSMATFKIKVTRRPLYHVVNLLSPVILLGVLNVCVFLLPVESGERIGFAVTCFLAYVVLLNTIMNFLPVSSLPMSLLSYYTFIMMLFSAAMSIAAIFTVRIYHKPEDSKVPGVLQGFIKLLTCRLDMSEQTKVTPVHPQRETVDHIEDLEKTDWDAEWGNENQRVEDITVKSDSTDSTGQEASTEVTWKEVSVVLDWFLFFAILGAEIFYSIAYLVPIFVRA